MTAVLKQVVAEVFAPFSIGLIFLIAGLTFLWVTRRQILGKGFVSFGTFLLLFFSHPLLWQSVFPPLEGRYDSLVLRNNSGQQKPSGLPPAKWIVVLGGGYEENENLPLSDQLGHETLFRIVEGIALHKALPESKLLFSGGPVTTRTPEAQIMGKAAEALGVDPKEMMLETKSQDTYSEARLIRPIVGGDDFILVTSGFHMPRSMALFRQEGLHPIPAPVGMPLQAPAKFAIRNLYPQAAELVRAQNNFREYMGFALLKLRGRI
jgi:uncharacterized SAM-binding protein YcdF (DUF218 family)